MATFVEYRPLIPSWPWSSIESNSNIGICVSMISIVTSGTNPLWMHSHIALEGTFDGQSEILRLFGSQFGQLGVHMSQVE